MIFKIILLVLVVIFLKGIVLSMIAKILSFVLEIPNLICAVILHFKKYQFLRVINDYQYQSAIENDIFLHYNFRALWRVCLSNGNGYKFGTFKDETLSSALGRKYLEKSLSYFGLALYYILYLIDFKTWKHRGHCIDAYINYESKLNQIK